MGFWVGVGLKGEIKWVGERLKLGYFKWVPQIPMTLLIISLTIYGGGAPKSRLQASVTQ